MNDQRDHRYRELLVTPIRACSTYLPKMGGDENINFDLFSSMYGSDPFYHWVGLDTAPMFAAHKAAGGMTSVYRQLGIGSERLFREILKDELGLSALEVVWSYTQVVAPKDGEAPKTKTLTLDGRVDLENITDSTKRERFRQWIEDQKALLKITIPLKGAVFEVRQGYKSADSKRQNGDILNATQALGHGYLPVLVIMSTQINRAVFERYLVNNWAVLRGHSSADALSGTFDFLRDVVGYDLPAFFERQSVGIRSEVEVILKKLLEAA